MEATTVYFENNFFSMGLTDIWDEQERRIGRLDLQDLFSSGVTVLDLHGKELASGAFRFFSNTWVVKDGDGNEAGELRGKFAFLASKYEYEHMRFGAFPIASEMFSQQYSIETADGDPAASFERTNHVLGPASFRLHNVSELPTAEWIAVVMGVHAIQQRRRSSVSM